MDWKPLLLHYNTREKTTKRRPNRDETLPITNKPKYPKTKGGKGRENKEQNGRTHVQENKRTT
jgi:hypothetical protein